MNNKQSLTLLAATLALGTAASAMAADMVIQGTVLNSTLKVTASTSKYANAIYSVQFRNKEFINATDHGRELQSASSFDGLGECFNPTEAGTAADGSGATSSSVPLSAVASGTVLQTSTNMAFWLLPGQPYGQPCGSTQYTSAQNTTIVSGHVLSKTVAIGYNGIANVLKYDIAFKVPEAHQSATFEALTGYMPPDFAVFLAYDPASRTLNTLSDGPGEQSKPVMLATKTGAYAMGVSSFGLPQSTYPSAGYGRFRFSDTTKWNCVYREGAIVANATYKYTCFVAIGNVDEVMSAQNALYGSSAALPPLFRFFNGKDHFLTANYSEGAGAGYTFEETAFHYYPSAQDSGMALIYRCYVSASGDHFVSRDSGCEGQKYEGSYGYVSTYSRTGLLPLYRFYSNSLHDHLTTTNYSEGANNGYAYEGVLGYVPG